MSNYQQLFAALVLLTNFTSHTQDQTKNQKPLTLMQSILVGGTVGALEVALPGQPLSVAMNRAVAKAANPTLKQPKFTPKTAYTGFIANAGGQMPITAIQKTIQVKSTTTLENWQDSKVTSQQKAGISLLAGVTGAVVDTPANAIQLYLQNPVNKGKTTSQACRALGPKMLHGFTPNAVLKEALFVVGYQWLAPQTTAIIKPYTSSDQLASALGGAVAGVTTAIVTQPGAVLRNTMQDNYLNHQTYKGLCATAKQIYSTNGMSGFWTGLPARGTRVAVAVPLYVTYTDYLEKKLKE